MACVLILVMIPVGLLIGAGILLGAIALANMCLPQPRNRYYDDDYDDWDDYDRPARRRNRSGKAIPPPTLGYAVAIVLVNGLISFAISFVIGLVMDRAGVVNKPGLMLMMQGFNLVIGFLISASVLTSMLPTTFPRACLVVVFQYVIVFVIALVIFVPLFLLGAGMNGFR